MNEDSRGLARHYNGRNYVPKYQYILYARKYPTRRETDDYAHRHTLMLPEHSASRLEFVPCALSMAFLLMRWEHVRTTFSTFLKEKPQIFDSIPVGNLPQNIKSLIHYFSFRTKWFKRKANTRSFKGGVSFLTLSL